MNDWLEIKGVYKANREFLSHVITPKIDAFFLETIDKDGKIEVLCFKTFDEAEKWSRFLDNIASDARS